MRKRSPATELRYPYRKIRMRAVKFAEDHLWALAKRPSKIWIKDYLRYSWECGFEAGRCVQRRIQLMKGRE